MPFGAVEVTQRQALALSGVDQRVGVLEREPAGVEVQHPASGVDLDRRGVLVVHRDALHPPGQGDEVGEVGLHGDGDVDPSQQLADGAHQLWRAALGEGCVDLALAHAGNGDMGVTGDGDQRKMMPIGRELGQDDRI
ncbi:hypothetical protein GCM10027030_17330 [Luteococcus sediminum]